MVLAWLSAGPAWGVAPVAGPPAPPAAAEPIVDLARRDVRAMRQARTAGVVALSAPLALHVGALAALASAGSGVDPQGVSVAGVGLSVAGGVAMVAAPLWVDLAAQRSKRLLRDQGLEVRRQSFPVVTGLVATVGVGMFVTAFANGGEDPLPVPLAAGYALGAASYGLAAQQLGANRRARVAAGWVAP